MSNQEFLTYLFNAIALGFLFIAAMDFGTRAVALYNQVKVASNPPLTNIKKPLIQVPPDAAPEVVSQLPEERLLSLPMIDVETVNVSFPQRKPALRLLSPAKEVVESPKSVVEEMLAAVDLNKLKLRQARKIAKALGIAQKVNGRDQKLVFLVSQIKFKLQQAKPELAQLVAQELLAS